MISREPTIERLAIARSLLLEPFGLTEATLGKALATIATHRIDDADLYFQKHVDGFLAAKEHMHLKDWSKELVVFSPVFTTGDRNHFAGKGFGAKDLRDYAALF